MRSAQKCGKRITHIDPALAALERHLWPGNVRELENVIERAVVMAEIGPRDAVDLPAEVARVGWPRMSSRPNRSAAVSSRRRPVGVATEADNGFADDSSDDPFGQENPAWERDHFSRLCANAPATRPKRPACWASPAARTSAS